MAVTPGATGYLRNGQWYAPTEDFGYGTNPYDPETQPQLYQQWQDQHYGDAQQIGQDYSPRRVNSLIATSLIPWNTGGPAFAAGVPTAAAVTPAAIAPAVAPAAVAPAAAALPASMAPAGAVPGVITAGGPGALADTVLPVVAGTGTGSSFLSLLARYGIPLAASTTTAVLNNRANNQAQQQLTDANTRAQADTRNMYSSTAQMLNSLYGQQQRQLGDIYAGQQATLAPYTSLGAGAAGLLGQGLGIANVAPAGGPVSTAPITPATVPGLYPSALTPTTSATKTTIPAIPGTPQVPFPGQTGTPTPQAQASAQTQSSYQGGMVRMQSPDGTEVESVPASQVAHFQSLGAKVVV